MGDIEKELCCNACGKSIEIIPKTNMCKEHLHINKEWGYFSKKDFMVHSFNICEECYDKWVNTFQVPVRKRIQTEWAIALTEDTLLPIQKESR